MQPAHKRSSQHKIRKEAADWVIRLSDNKVTAAERSALDAWLERDVAHVQAFEKAQQLLGDARLALTKDPGFTKRLIRKKDRPPLVAIAGLALILGGGSLFIAADGPLRMKADVVSSANEMPVVVLPDGSHIFLNADSAISEEFAADIRKVTLLKGEAYFEVAKDPARPFVVEAGKGRVRVLGTAFDVNLVDGGAEVTVTENTVSVTGSASEDAAILEPGNRISYDKYGILGPVAVVPPGFETPWRSGRLIFEERPLSTVLQEISRHIPGRMVVTSTALADRRISGSFDLSDPQEAMRSFEHAFGLRVMRAGSLLTVIY